MLDAVFISDLHLQPDEPIILNRFSAFIKWAAANTRAVYILGDFFHVWAGDDAMKTWEREIANRLLNLTEKKVRVYLMPGNRDFLLGDNFAKLAGVILLKEPSIASISGNKFFLAHGDKYCTKDRSHQWFRLLTRNRLFIKLFLKISLDLRKKIVSSVRERSANNNKTSKNLEIINTPMIKDMRKKNADIIIHGHTHRPGLIKHLFKEKIYSQYILSDWDDKPQVLCYDSTAGLYFDQNAIAFIGH